MGTQFSTSDITTPTLDLANLFPNLKSTTANQAFRNATNVTRITFPSGFTTLKENQFRNSSITIIFGDPVNGSALKTVGWGAIPGDYPTVVLYSSTPPTSSYFTGKKCYVPDAALDTYKTQYSSQASKFYPVSEWPG